MRWGGSDLERKKKKILDRKYWYVKENKIIKECDGQFYETDYIYDYYCFFDGMTYLLWIDSITSRSDDIIELQIGCINRENIRKDRVEIQQVTDEYQKIKIIMEMIKLFGKAGDFQ